MLHDTRYVCRRAIQRGSELLFDFNNLTTTVETGLQINVMRAVKFAGIRVLHIG